MAKENFGQAMNELFGVGKANGKLEENTEKAAAKTEKVVKETVAPAAPSAEKNYQATVISEGAYFEGTLKAQGDVEIYGIFKGNIESKGNVKIYTDVEGDIIAGDVEILQKALKGNVTASGKVKIADGSRVNGNVNRESIYCSGNVTGNVTVKETASFDSTAHITGDISAKTLSISRGAYIDGKIAVAKA